MAEWHEDRRAAAQVARVPLPAPEQPAPETDPTAASQRMRVLVIDDDRNIRDLIAYVVANKPGGEVLTATNGAERLALYQSERPDCVIVDVQMPVMNGFQFLRALRGDGASAHTPVIIVSALTDEPERQAGALCGVDAYVTKPFTPSGLRATVERVLRVTAAERERRMLELADAEWCAAGATSA